MSVLVVIIAGVRHIWSWNYDIDIYSQPVVASSGIPEVKGYLNGIRIRKAFNIKTLIGKVVSILLFFQSY